MAYFADMVSPHGYHTSGVTSLVEPNFISKVTLSNKDYLLSCMHINIVL